MAFQILITDYDLIGIFFLFWGILCGLLIVTLINGLLLIEVLIETYQFIFDKDFRKKRLNKLEYITEKLKEYVKDGK